MCRSVSFLYESFHVDRVMYKLAIFFHMFCMNRIWCLFFYWVDVSENDQRLFKFRLSRTIFLCMQALCPACVLWWLGKRAGGGGGMFLLGKNPFCEMPWGTNEEERSQVVGFSEPLTFNLKSSFKFQLLVHNNLLKHCCLLCWVQGERLEGIAVPYLLRKERNL